MRLALGVWVGTYILVRIILNSDCRNAMQQQRVSHGHSITNRIFDNLRGNILNIFYTGIITYTYISSIRAEASCGIGIRTSMFAFRSTYMYIIYMYVYNKQRCL